jgi:hypothetical protein
LRVSELKGGKGNIHEKNKKISTKVTKFEKRKSVLDGRTNLKVGINPRTADRW